MLNPPVLVHIYIENQSETWLLKYLVMSHCYMSHLDFPQRHYHSLLVQILKNKFLKFPSNILITEQFFIFLKA